MQSIVHAIAISALEESEEGHLVSTVLQGV